MWYYVVLWKKYSQDNVDMGKRMKYIGDKKRGERRQTLKRKLEQSSFVIWTKYVWGNRYMEQSLFVYLWFERNMFEITDIWRKDRRHLKSNLSSLICVMALRLRQGDNRYETDEKILRRSQPRKRDKP